MSYFELGNEPSEAATSSKLKNICSRSGFTSCQPEDVLRTHGGYRENKGAGTATVVSRAWSLWPVNYERDPAQLDIETERRTKKKKNEEEKILETARVTSNYGAPSRRRINFTRNV